MMTTNTMMTASSLEALHIESARRDDVRALIEMLARATPDCAPETVWALPWAWTQFFVVREPDSGTIAAASGLFNIDMRQAEIRGLVVHPDYRGRGLASRLVRHLSSCAARRNRTVVCVTRKPMFFAQLGFRSTAPTWLGPHRSHEKASQPPRVAMKLHVPRDLSSVPEKGVESHV
jgi:N-acetylglutamate synthase-like GNAT family acetyltransferase